VGRPLDRRAKPLLVLVRGFQQLGSEELDHGSSGRHSAPRDIVAILPTQALANAENLRTSLPGGRSSVIIANTRARFDSSPPDWVLCQNSLVALYKAYKYMFIGEL